MYNFNTLTIHLLIEITVKNIPRNPPLYLLPCSSTKSGCRYPSSRQVIVNSLFGGRPNLKKRE